MVQSRTRARAEAASVQPRETLAMADTLITSAVPRKRKVAASDVDLESPTNKRRVVAAGNAPLSSTSALSQAARDLSKELAQPKQGAAQSLEQSAAAPGQPELQDAAVQASAPGTPLQAHQSPQLPGLSATSSAADHKEQQAAAKPSGKGMLHSLFSPVLHLLNGVGHGGHAAQAAEAGSGAREAQSQSSQHSGASQDDSDVENCQPAAVAASRSRADGLISSAPALRGSRTSSSNGDSAAASGAAAGGGPAGLGASVLMPLLLPADSTSSEEALVVEELEVEVDVDEDQENAASAATVAALAQLEPPATETSGEEEEDDEDFLEFDPYCFIRNLPPLEACVPAGSRKRLLLPRQTRRSKTKTLVLDLDETLVHSSLDSFELPDFTFPVHFNGREHTVNVRQRPHLAAFLERCAALFEVVVFTASQKVYAEQLLHILDPDRRLIRHRVYRDSCVYVDGNYLKDLTILGRDLRSTVIVDNSPQAFGFQLANGIPIESWYDDRDDDELLRLLPFLEQLVDVEDVRPLVAQTFKLHELVQRCSRGLPPQQA